MFRKVALDRISSPEQLDQMMHITAPRGWIALASLALLIAVGLGWGVLGELPDKVAGNGILVRTDGVLEVVAPASGRVADLTVGVGDYVREGQVVAWVDQPELFARVKEAEAQLQALRRAHDEKSSFSRGESALEERTAAEQRANLAQTVAAQESSLRWLDERIRAQQSLVDQGLITRSVLMQTQQQRDQTLERIRTSRAELLQIDSRRTTADHGRAEEMAGEERQIAQAEMALANLQREYRAASQIASTHTGRVLEVTTQRGKIISVGESLLSLDRSGRGVRGLMAVMYVPSIQGKRVRPGMTIQIAPSTVRQEEFGMMLGRVVFVSDYPATPKGMKQMLNNDQLVAGLSGGAAPYEVHAELAVDPSTVSQYRWTSSHGPPVRVASGTLATGQIIVETQRPIAKVIPLVRKYTGI